MATLRVVPSLPAGDIGCLGSGFDWFVERAAILEHDGGFDRAEAEDRAAQELGYPTASVYRRHVLAYWRGGLVRLLAAGQGQKGNELVRTAIAFIRDGWADQALDLGWTEQELMWADQNAPWERYDALGAAYLSDGIKAITATTIGTMKPTGSMLTLRRARGNGRSCLPWERRDTNSNSTGDKHVRS